MSENRSFGSLCFDEGPGYDKSICANLTIGSIKSGVKMVAILGAKVKK